MSHETVIKAKVTTVIEVLWHQVRGIARAWRCRHDRAVIRGRKRGPSPVIGPVIPVIATVLLWLLATPVHAAPTFQGISTIAASTGADVTVNLPAHQADDILLLIGVVRDQNDTVTVSGWTQMTGSPFDRGGTSRYWIFWKRAASASETDPVFNKNTPNGDTYAAVINYRGASATGDPWEVKGAPATGTSDPATCTGITSLSTDSLVVVALAGEDNNNSGVTTTSTNPATYAAHYLESGTGGDGMIAFSEATRATAGATGDVSVAFSDNDPRGWGCMVLALKHSAATLSSAADQTFNLGDAPTVASTLTVTDFSTPTITAGNDIRIRIPATFSMTWDTAVTTVTLGGGAAGKVSATLSAYEDGNRTVVLNVTSNFVASDQLTITGLGFANFTAAEAADNLELVVAGPGGAAVDEDDKTIAIVDPGIASAGSRILNDDAGRTPVAGEDVDVANWNKSASFLVTIGIQTTAGGGADCQDEQGDNKLQWRNVTDAPGVWNNLGTAAGPEMRLFNSANLTHRNNLTAGEAQITGTGTYRQGEEVEDNNDFDWSNRTRNGEHTAIQFPIDPSGGLDGKQYQFRFIVDTLCDVAAGTNVVSVKVTLAAPPPPAAGGFNAYETATAAGAITGVIKTKIAGGVTALDMIALNAAKTAIETTFTGTVRVEVLDAADNSGALDVNGCRPTWSVIQTLAPDPAFIAGDNGRKTISFTQANSYPNVRLRITYPAGAPTVTGCTGDNFAIRPGSFAGFAVTDTDWQTAGTGRALDLVTFGATTPTHKAGRPFSVRATAVNAAAATTTNYAGSPTASLAACAGAACTAAFGNLTLSTTFAAGQLASDVASYDNVGSFRVELVDSSFANVDTGDSSALEREIRSAAIDIGRFVPDHFAVSLNSPVFGAACGPFTYIGQAFNYTTAPVITVTAQDFANNTTTLYAAGWWRITSASLTGKSYTAATGALDVTGVPGTDPVIFAAGSGMGTLTFSSGSGLFFIRGTPTAPASPYDAEISLAINVIDADGVALATNPARFGTASAGSGIAFNTGKSMRFGRLAIRNASGSQLVPLLVRVEAQYWLGAPTNAFVTNAADNCTVIATNNDAMGNFTGNLSGTPTCETAISGGGALSGGRRPFQLAAPGAGNSGSVDLTINLDASASGTTCTTLGAVPVAATTANLPYLRGNWSGGAYDQNPSARATFGVYPGSEEVIYVRENFQ